MHTLEERRGGEKRRVKSLCEGDAVTAAAPSREAGKEHISTFTYRMKVPAHSSLLLSFQRS